MSERYLRHSRISLANLHSSVCVEQFARRGQRKLTEEIDGFYATYMTGPAGQGFAMMVFFRGAIAGADPLGVLFDGGYTIDRETDSVSAKVRVRVPPNGTNIQGVTSGPAGITYEVDLKIPTDFEKRDFIQIQTPFGAVNMRLKKLRPLEEVSR